MKTKSIRSATALLSVFFISSVTSFAMMTADNGSQTAGNSDMPISIQVTSLPTDTDPNTNISQCVNLTYTMSFGSKDSQTNGEVSDLQFYLQGKGYLATEPTGYFGQATKRAVQAFQSANGINPNGVVGPITRAKIKALSCVAEVSSLPSQPIYTTQTSQDPVSKSSGNPSGMINLDSTVCTILIGQSQCGVKISWNVLNPVAGKTEFIVSGGYEYTIKQDSYPSTTFMNRPGENVAKYVLKNNGTILDTETVTSKCVQGSTWSGGVCKAEAGDAPSITGVNFSSDGTFSIQGTLFNQSNNTVTINGVSKSLPSANNTTNTLTTNGLVTTTDGLVITSTLQEFNLVLGGTYSVVVTSDSKTSNAYSFTVPATMPYPVANLTISASGYGTSVRDITYPVGTHNIKRWSSSNGGSFSSVAWRTGSCTNRTNGDATEVWQANSAVGTSNGIGNAGDVGCVVHIKYMVTNPMGTASDQINVTVTAQATTDNSQPTGAISLESPTCVIPPGQAQCGGRLSWKVNNPVAGKTEFIISGGFNYTIRQDSYPPTTFMNGRGENTSTYILKNNGTTLDTKTVTSRCAAGTNWNGSVCTATALLLPATPIAVAESVGESIVGANTVVVSAAKKAVSALSGVAQVSAMSCVNLNSNMHRGFETTSVTKLQEFLVEKGLLKEKPSGFFGDLTISAVKAYQKSLGLKETGMVYDATREAIKQETCGI